MPMVRKMTCKEYLDATRDLHGGWGYDEFHEASTGPITLDGIEVKLTQKQIGDRMGGMSRQTIADWQIWDMSGARPARRDTKE